MRKRPTLLCALAVGLLPRFATAQPPELAGRWTLILEASRPDPAEASPPIPATASSGWGREITIGFEPGRVTIERHQFAELDVQPPMRFAYALDGAVSRNVVNMGRGPQEQVAQASFRGPALVIASRHQVGTDLEAEVTQVFSLDSEGALLVETTRTATGVRSTVKTRYRRNPPATK